MNTKYFVSYLFLSEYLPQKKDYPYQCFAYYYYKFLIPMAIDRRQRVGNRSDFLFLSFFSLPLSV